MHSTRNPFLAQHVIDHVAVLINHSINQLTLQSIHWVCKQFFIYQTVLFSLERSCGEPFGTLLHQPHITKLL